MAFLDEIAHRQAEMAELRRHGDDEPHMRGGDAVERLLVVLFLPADRQVVLFVTFEIGRPHRGLDQSPIHGFVGHAALLLPGRTAGEAAACASRDASTARATTANAQGGQMFQEAIAMLASAALAMCVTVENRLASGAFSVR